jgi:hypothetical protein
VTIDTVRPLPMFLGISGPSLCFAPEAFNTPVKKFDKSTPEKFKSRLKLNFAFFLSNYALVATGTALIVFLMHPGMLISMAIVWGLWALHHFLISNEVNVFGRNVGMLLSISHRSNALVVLTSIVIIWKCLFPVLTVVGISGFIILTHALLRDPKNVEISSANDYRSNSDDDSGEISQDSSEVLVENPGLV